MNKSCIIIVLGILFTIYGQAQQLDQVGKKGGVKINGGISVNQVYQYSESYNVMEPYSLVATGNISASLYGWSIPLSFTWSNYTWTYTQPFNQVALHPSYKWIKAHIGYTNMSFSSWSLSGHSFAGAGVELTPSQNLSISAMCGRLVKETRGDTANRIDPAYQRMGTGIKVDYKFKKARVGVSMFYAADNEGCLYEADSLGITPEENMILGVTTSLSLTRRLKLDIEGFNSVVVENSRLGDVIDWRNNYTNRYQAFKANFSWSSKIGQVGGAVERVDPGYKSLGAYYTTDDYLNYTLNFSTALLQNKVSLAVSTGIQVDNLNDKSDQESEDQVTSLQIAFTPSQKFNFSVSYSNFYNYTYIQSVFDQVEAQTSYELMDTVSYTQINEAINLSTNYSLGDKEKNPQSLNLSLSYQKASQEQSDHPEHTNNHFLNGSGGYSYSFKPLEMSCGLSMNYSINRSSGRKSKSIGPLFYARKYFYEKHLKTNMNISLNNSFIDGEQTGKIVTCRLGATYSIKKKHNFTLSYAYSNKENNGIRYSNYTATLGYSYNFNWPKSNKAEAQTASL